LVVLVLRPLLALGWKQFEPLVVGQAMLCLYVRSYVPASMGASTKMGFKFDSKTGAAAHRRLLLR
jgi:hypothetical protein